MNRILSVVALGVFLASACGGQTPLAPTNPPQTLQPVDSATLSGWVYERAEASDPCISEAVIEVAYSDGARTRVISDEEGYYEITVRPGRLTISASKEGYEAKTWELTLLEDTVLNFALIPR